MVDENELRVIHYTLGPLKPWDWWTSWLVKPVDVWQVFELLIILFYQYLKNVSSCNFLGNHLAYVVM